MTLDPRSLLWPSVPMMAMAGLSCFFTCVFVVFFNTRYRRLEAEEGAAHQTNGTGGNCGTYYGSIGTSSSSSAQKTWRQWIRGFLSDELVLDCFIIMLWKRSKNCTYFNFYCRLSFFPQNFIETLLKKQTHYTHRFLLLKDIFTSFVFLTKCKYSGSDGFKLSSLIQDGRHR